MRCNYCEWRCELAGGDFGVCRMYIEDGGAIKERFPHSWSSCIPSRIESIPFYHVWPGSRSLVIGTSGCNFSCRYCSNGFVAKEDPGLVFDGMITLTPAELVRKARQMGCHNIVFNVNEPAMSFPTLVELAEVAGGAGIPMGCLTNAYTTEESTELLASIFSFFNVGLKGLSAGFNREYLGIPSAGPVLRNIRRLAATAHVEITTPVIELANDNELDEIARFIADVDPEIPWHVFRLLPEHEMKEARYPDIDAIDRALRSARKLLPYVYFHNFVGSDWVNTICPGCGATVIERFSLGCGGDRLHSFNCDGTVCPDCRREIRLHGVKVAWNAGEVRP
ncbi:MAG: radical SAM protein [Deltaproteobacteria bacterium]